MEAENLAVSRDGETKLEHRTCKRESPDTHLRHSIKIANGLCPRRKKAKQKNTSIYGVKVVCSSSAVQQKVNLFQRKITPSSVTIILYAVSVQFSHSRV